MQLILIYCVRSHSHNPQAHTTGYVADICIVYHPVKRKIVLSITVFFRCVNISKNHLTNAFHNGRSIYLCVLINLPLNVLFLIGQKVIGVPSSPDIVLAEQSVKTTLHSLSHGNLVQANIICHQDDKVIQVCRNVIDITDKIQELQHIHILLFNTIAIVSCPLTTLNYTSNCAI